MTYKYSSKRNITSALYIIAGKKNSTLVWFMKLAFTQLNWQASNFTGFHYIFREQE